MEFKQYGSANHHIGICKHCNGRQQYQNPGNPSAVEHLPFSVSQIVTQNHKTHRTYEIGQLYRTLNHQRVIEQCCYDPNGQEVFQFGQFRMPDPLVEYRHCQIHSQHHPKEPVNRRTRCLAHQSVPEDPQNVHYSKTLNKSYARNEIRCRNQQDCEYR